MTVFPDGSLIDEVSNREYYGLYWEGIPKEPLKIPNGTIVKGEEVRVFLESALKKLGLTSREANKEMIVYWLPILERNPYNLIHFSFDEYIKSAPLAVIPEPTTIIRVMMVFKALDAPVDIAPQILPKKIPERKGFTLVEWGGTEIREEN